WSLWRHSPDPRVRSYLIHRLSPFGVAADIVLKRLQEERDVTVRRALLLCLGEYGEKQIPLEARQVLLPKLQHDYRSHPHPGLHPAAEWLLRRWQQEAWLKGVNDAWAVDKERHKKAERLAAVKAASAAPAPPQWYVNSQGLTMVLVPGPSEFLMGSP